MRNLEEKTKAAIAYIKKGYKFTKRDIRSMFNYDNVGDLVLRLRRKHTINKVMKKSKTGAIYAEYQLIK